jgi:hypothetical protein
MKFRRKIVEMGFPHRFNAKESLLCFRCKKEIQCLFLGLWITIKKYEIEVKEVRVFDFEGL